MEMTTMAMDMSTMDMNDSSMDMGMEMYFHLGYQEYVLFETCETNSPGAMAGACVIIFIVAILYEGFKYFRETLLQKSLLASIAGAGGGKHVEELTSSKDQIVMHAAANSAASRMLSCGHLVQTLLHIIQVFVSYCLMLVFMTFNVWLCLAVVVGAGVGYFLFGWKRAVVVDANEHCH